MPRPPSRLEAKKYRGQSDLGEKALCVLGFFNEAAFLKATVCKFGDTAYSAARSVESDGKGKSGDRALAKSRPEQEMDVRIRRYSFHAAPRARFEVREDCPDDGKLALCAKMGKSGAAQKLKEGYDEAAV